MKIALFCSSRNIIPTKKTGGTEQPIFYLAKGLAEKGHQVTLYAAKGSKIPGVEVREISPFTTCVKQKYLNIQERIASFYDLSALADFFYSEADKYDIIQFNSYMFYEILPFTKWTKTPTIIRINYPHSLIYPYIKSQLLEFKNVHYLPISKFIMSAMPELPYLDPIYPAVDMDDFKFSDRSKDYLLFIGRICHNKGAHIAIEVAKKTKKKLIIAGRIDQEGGQEYFKIFIEPYLDNKNIKYVGEVNFKTKIKLYQGAQATLFPIQWDEPFGNAPIESMACGTPVITFARAAMSESVKDEVSGFIVRDGSVNEMVRAVKRIAKIDSKQTREWAEDNFSNKRIVDQFEEIYKSTKVHKEINLLS